MKLDWFILLSMPLEVIKHKYLRISFVDSVLPAPVSPSVMMDCDLLNVRIMLIASFAVYKYKY